MPYVVIVGGGLAGLACAVRLHNSAVPFRLLEATDRLGGRLRTDSFDRFRLDCGFQVIADPMALGQLQRLAPPPLLDCDALRLRRFPSTAVVRDAGRFRTIGGSALHEVLARSKQIWQSLLPSVASGRAVLPALGMEAIPRQLAARLDGHAISLQHTVTEVHPGGVRLSDGTSIDARIVVLATESPAVERLTATLSESTATGQVAPWDSTCCVYFAAVDSPEVTWRAASPHGQSADGDPGEKNCPTLILRGDESAGPVHHAVPISSVAPEYAPPGHTLWSITLAGPPPVDREQLDQVRAQLRSWLGESVDQWTHLRTYAVPYAWPAEPQQMEPFGPAGPILCGDSCGEPTVEGAIRSGLQAAEAVLRRL